MTRQCLSLFLKTGSFTFVCVFQHFAVFNVSLTRETNSTGTQVTLIVKQPTKEQPQKNIHGICQGSEHTNKVHKIGAAKLLLQPAALVKKAEHVVVEMHV